MCESSQNVVFVHLLYSCVNFKDSKTCFVCDNFTNLLLKKTLTFYKGVDIIDTKWLQIYCVNISNAANKAIVFQTCCFLLLFLYGGGILFYVTIYIKN